MFPSDNYNHFPRYQGKFSGEEIDDLLSTVKTWKGGTSTGSGSLVFANPSVKSLQDWWSTTALASAVDESDGSKAISGPALINWWNGKYINNAAISWDTITSDKVPSKGLIDGQLRAIKEQLNVLNGKLNTCAPTDYIVKASTLFTFDEISVIADEIRRNPENEEIKAFDKSTDVILENFDGNIKRIIVDLSDVTSKNTDFITFNCGVNSTTFKEVNASFSWFTGSPDAPCMNIFTLCICYSDSMGYYLYRYCIWHSGYSTLNHSNS